MIHQDNDICWEMKASEKFDVDDPMKRAFVRWKMQREYSYACGARAEDDFLFRFLALNQLSRSMLTL